MADGTASPSSLSRRCRAIVGVLLACGMWAALLPAPWALAQSGRGVSVVTIRDKAGNALGVYQESHALVIGVSRYTNGWPSLPGVKEDVEAVADGLRAAGFTVTLVNNPDRDQLDRAFTDFIAGKGNAENNRILIYFAGHGHTLRPKYGGEPLGYIVPTDAPNPNVDEQGFLRKAISMQRMEEYATQIQARHAIFLFDSCFSGTVFSGARGIPETIQAKTAKPVRMFITAGDEGQTVPDHSIFRPQFLRGIQGDADLDKDGYVTGMELGYYLETTVTNYSKGTQTPKYGKIMKRNLDQGDFVFALPGGRDALAGNPPEPAPLVPPAPAPPPSNSSALLVAPMLAPGAVPAATVQTTAGSSVLWWVVGGVAVAAAVSSSSGSGKKKSSSSSTGSSSSSSCTSNCGTVGWSW